MLPLLVLKQRVMTLGLALVLCLLALGGCSAIITTAFVLSCGPFPYGGSSECGGAWLRHLLPEELRRPVPPMPPEVEQLAREGALRVKDTRVRWDTTSAGRVCYHADSTCDLLPCLSEG